MAKKKKLTGQINFYKSMAVLGLMVAGTIVYAFVGAAPNLSDTDYHKKKTPAGKCLQCHMINPGRNPIMPHRVMDPCILCHRPAKKN